MCSKSKILVLGKSYSRKDELLKALLDLKFYQKGLIKVYTDNPDKCNDICYEVCSPELFDKLHKKDKIKKVYYDETNHRYGIKDSEIRYAKIISCPIEIYNDYSEEFKDYKTVYVESDEEQHRERIAMMEDNDIKSSIIDKMNTESEQYDQIDSYYDIVIKSSSFYMNPIQNIVFYIQRILMEYN